MLKPGYWATMAAAIMAAAILLAACGGPQGDKSAASADAAVAAESFQGRVIEVVLTDYAFKPASIELVKDEPVMLIVRNEGRTVHDLVIVGLGIDVRTEMLRRGESQTLVFTPLQSGRLETFCSVPGHRTLGMVGELFITNGGDD